MQVPIPYLPLFHSFSLATGLCEGLTKQNKEEDRYNTRRYTDLNLCYHYCLSPRRTARFNNVESLSHETGDWLQYPVAIGTLWKGGYVTSAPLQMTSDVLSCWPQTPILCDKANVLDERAGGEDKEKFITTFDTPDPHQHSSLCELAGDHIVR
ncbi:hypothetical protein J6590_032580 [Homalodisca vitripennis]|nr:hypothetical protein J6590_032580 [Homalodisca vitripennis]